MSTKKTHIIPHNTVFNSYEVDHTSPDIGRKTMLVNARRLHENDMKTHILLAMEDITERREIKKEREKARKELEATKIAEDEAHEYATKPIDTRKFPELVRQVLPLGQP